MPLRSIDSLSLDAIQYQPLSKTSFTARLVYFAIQYMEFLGSWDNIAPQESLFDITLETSLLHKLG
jgi:hypothetical protein